MNIDGVEINLNPQHRYTLEEAREELARRECAFAGHDWEIVQDDTGPILLLCNRCPAIRKVEANDGR